MAKKFRPIPIPSGVEVRVESGQVLVKGKLGSLPVGIPGSVVVKSDGKSIDVSSQSEGSRALVGTIRSLLGNAFHGVTQGFEKVLQLRGMGYRAQKTKAGVQLQCGYSHVVDFEMPPGVTAEVSQLPNPDDTKQQMFEISVRGIDCHAVGQIATRIRATKPPDPYQGKGVRYRGEYVRKKAGKRAVGAQT